MKKMLCMLLCVLLIGSAIFPCLATTTGEDYFSPPEGSPIYDVVKDLEPFVYSILLKQFPDMMENYILPPGETLDKSKLFIDTEHISVFYALEIEKIRTVLQSSDIAKELDEKKAQFYFRCYYDGKPAENFFWTINLKTEKPTPVINPKNWNRLRMDKNFLLATMKKIGAEEYRPLLLIKCDYWYFVLSEKDGQRYLVSIPTEITQASKEIERYEAFEKQQAALFQKTAWTMEESLSFLDALEKYLEETPELSPPGSIGSAAGSTANESDDNTVIEPQTETAPETEKAPEPEMAPETEKAPTPPKNTATTVTEGDAGKDVGDTVDPEDDAPQAPWLWIGIVGGAVALVALILVFALKKKKA